MKKITFILVVFLTCINCYAVGWQELNNGWKHYDSSISDSPESGLFSYQIDNYLTMMLYVDFYKQDTLCEFILNCEDEKFQKKVFYFFEDKATYFFNVFREGEESRFSILRFSYDEKDDFTTGFSSTGKGQNQLASDVFKCITTGINVKFIVPDKMAEYQEIKSFNLPYMK